MNAVHFGAGNIGRGFIGILLKNSKYDITFVDVNTDLINNLKANGEYTIHYLNQEGTSDHVTGVKALHGGSEVEAVIEQLTTCDLITTSLGQDNLKYISDNILQGIKARIAVGSTANLDIIACENGIRVSTFFKEIIYSALNDEEQAYADRYIGFVDCTVDRIVPNQVNENICDVKVEPTFEWVLNSTQVKANNNISDAKYSADLAYYNKRKLLTVNLTHSLIGYIGYNLGKEYVHETIAIPAVEAFVSNVLIDIRNSLVIEFGVEAEVQDAYAQKTITRFKNDKIVDELSRVARNPLTKLGNSERYVSPLKVLCEANYDCKYICQAIGYALAYNNPQEPQALEMSNIISEVGIKQGIKQITGLTNESVINAIAEQYQAIV